MGAWGTGVFENDDVLDWKADLVETDSLDFIRETLEAALEAEYIEADLAAGVIGAVEVLAALQGKPGPEISQKTSYAEDLDEWITLYKGQGRELLAIGKKALKKVRKDSELKELWEESEAFANWMNVLAELEGRL